MIDQQALDSALTYWAQKKDLAGVSACIMGPEGPVYTYTHGVRSASGTPVDSDTMFGIASMSKSITALCLCILHCEGKMSIHDPVSKFFPAFRLSGQPQQSITVRHLCMHTAGIPPMEPLEWSIAMNSTRTGQSEWLTQMRKTSPNQMDTIDQVIDYIASSGYHTLGAPGEVFSYSNEGYAILSYIVDQAAGIPLEQFMHERIFAPLQMNRTLLDNGVEASRALSGGNLTSLFDRDADGKRICDDFWSILPPFRGCAMVRSTAPDIAAYYRMLACRGMANGVQVIPAEAVDLLLGSAHPVSDLSVMCMGINKRRKAGHIICEHSGGLHGVSTKGGLLLDEGYGFSVLSNQSDEDMDELMWCMYNAVMGLPLDESHEWFIPAGCDFDAPQMLRGRYIAHEGLPSVLSIRWDGAVMTGERDGDAVDLCYCGGTRFIARNPVTGRNRFRLEFLIREGRAWGVRVGTRVFDRD